MEQELFSEVLGRLAEGSYEQVALRVEHALIQSDLCVFGKPIVFGTYPQHALVLDGGRILRVEYVIEEDGSVLLSRPRALDIPVIRYESEVRLSEDYMRVAAALLLRGDGEGARKCMREATRISDTLVESSEEAVIAIRLHDPITQDWYCELFRVPRHEHGTLCEIPKPGLPLFGPLYDGTLRAEQIAARRDEVMARFGRLVEEVGALVTRTWRTYLAQYVTVTAIGEDKAFARGLLEDLALLHSHLSRVHPRVASVDSIAQVHDVTIKHLPAYVVAIQHCEQAAAESGGGF